MKISPRKRRIKGQQLENSRRKEINRKLQKIQHMNNKDQKGYNKEIRAHKEIIQESFAELKDPSATPRKDPQGTTGMNKSHQGVGITMV